MAKITASDIEKDLRETEVKIRSIDSLITKTEGTYLTSKSLNKSNESLLKTIRKSIKSKTQEYYDDVQGQEETAIQKINRESSEKYKQDQQIKQENKLYKTLFESLINTAAVTAVVSTIPSSPTSSRPDGTNGRLKPDQLKDVGDGFKLWTPAADAYLEMKAAAAKDKVYFRLSSAYRTIEEQQVLVDELGQWSPTNPGAALPGTSPHGWGIAIDISSPGSQQWINRYGAKYGWFPTVFNEPWHFEWKGGQPKVEPVSNTNVNQISKSAPTSSLNLISLGSQEQQDPPFLIMQQPQVADASMQMRINKPRSNPFFIVPTG
jgi:LAS superfamily LD-carboxypeptidase LdcB